MPRTAVLRRLVLISSLLWAAVAQSSTMAVAVQDASGKGLVDAVVYAEGEQALNAKPANAEIEQRGLKFLPMVTVVQTGTTILFPNNDKVRHHIYSFSPAHKFDQKLYSGQAAAPQLFDKAGTVVLGCNIHDKMLAFVKVVETPYFAKTDSSGAARLELPPGKYTLKAWHYNATGSQTVEQALLVKPGDATASAVLRLTLKPPVTDADAASNANF